MNFNKYSQYLLKRKYAHLYIECAKNAQYQLEKGLSPLCGRVSASVYQITRAICAKWRSGILPEDLKETINQLATK